LAYICHEESLACKVWNKFYSVLKVYLDSLLSLLYTVVQYSFVL
jgi:hypothetical protein